MRVVILVPRRAGIADRDRLWAYCRERWETEHPTWPIFFGESPDGPFNRSAAINDAARQAGDWDVALVVDADVVADPEQVVAAIDRAAETNRLTFAYTKYHALSENFTKQVLGGFRGDWTPGIKTRMGTHVSSILAVPRPLWDLVGGFDERCEGWGHDDTIFAHVCRVMGGGCERIPGIVWHLFHKPSPEARKGTGGHRASGALARRYWAIQTPEEMWRFLADRKRNGVALMVLTHGRRECIDLSIDSAHENLKGIPIIRTVICDDSGDIEYQAWLRWRFPDCELVHGKPGGFSGNVRRMWETAIGTGEPWIFWLEDDFTFNETIDLRAMAAVMANHPYLTQMLLLRQPWFPNEVEAGGVIQWKPDAYEEVTDGPHTWTEHRLGFWTNPCLVRRSFLVAHTWPEGQNSEAKFGRTVMVGDARSAFWGGRDDPPLVHHAGERTGFDY